MVVRFSFLQINSISVPLALKVDLVFIETKFTEVKQYLISLNRFMDNIDGRCGERPVTQVAQPTSEFSGLALGIIALQLLEG